MSFESRLSRRKYAFVSATQYSPGAWGYRVEVEATEAHNHAKKKVQSILTLPRAPARVASTDAPGSTQNVKQRHTIMQRDVTQKKRDRVVTTLP